jgi:tetratricopeptide (TPR) repeat protein
MRQWPAEAGSYYVLANILWQRQRYEDALELYRFAICLKDKEEDIARAYFEASRFLRQDEEALEFLKRRWERLKNQSSMTGRTLAWAYSQLGRYPEAVAVLDASMTAHPEDGELMLEVANLVTQQSSGDHARAVDLLAAARPLAPRRTWLRTAARMAAVQGNASQTLDYWQQLLKIQPLAMDAHDAAVSLLATTQNQEAAADHLQAYTVQFPHYYPLHLLQVEWYRQTSQVEAYLAAARKLVQLAPQNDASLVYLGDAQLLHDEPEQAYEAFNSAIELNPANSRAGLFLFDLQLQQDNLSAAEETLKIVKHYSDGPITTTKAIRLAIRRNDVDLAAGGLKRLCVTPDESGLALQIAINDLSDAGLDQLISETMDEAIEWPDALPEVGVYWMSACIAFGKPGCVRQLRELVSRGAIGERALEIYLISLVRSGQPGRLRDFVKRNRFWLAENAATCTLAAGALKDIGDSSEAMEWAQDLLNLQGLRPWMLTTPVELFWDAGQMDRVVEISKQALLLPPDRMTLVHRIWLAAVEAFSGDAESALDRLGLVDSMRLDPLSYFLYIMTDAVARISVAPVSQRRQVFRDIRKQVQQAFQETKDSPQVIATQRRFYRQSLKFIGREVGDIRVWIWCYWQILLS